jgi:hypothetical protein
MAIVVIPRVEKDGTPILFFPGEQASLGRIVCYAHLGQHSEAVFGYYYRMTKPDKLGVCKHLLREYYNLGPIEDRQELIIRQRIRCR